jgi:MraZ protein
VVGGGELLGLQWILVDFSGRQWYKQPPKHEFERKALQAVELSALMGHSPAKIDEKGRLKVPASFRKLIEERWGPDCFITSKDGERALIYPMPVWLDFHSRIAKVPSSSLAKEKLMDRLNYYGHPATIDAQGRLLIPTVLRQVAGIADDVVVLGSQDHLTVWNEQRIQKRLIDQPLTPEDLKELELHGV